jgi:hypothetical protein
MIKSALILDGSIGSIITLFGIMHADQIFPAFALGDTDLSIDRGARASISRLS